LLTGNPQATTHDGTSWLLDLCRDLSIPSLRKFGIEQKDFPAICEKAAVASSMKGNPVQLEQVELAEILERAL
jgi:alcohol dehydrogenase class IV